MAGVGGGAGESEMVGQARCVSTVPCCVHTLHAVKERGAGWRARGREGSGQHGGGWMCVCNAHAVCTCSVYVMCVRGAWGLAGNGRARGGGERLAWGDGEGETGQGGGGKEWDTIGVRTVCAVSVTCVRDASVVCAACAHCLHGACPLRVRRARGARGRAGDGGSGQRGREKTVGDVPLGALCVRSACVDRTRGAGTAGVSDRRSHCGGGRAVVHADGRGSARCVQ